MDFAKEPQRVLSFCAGYGGIELGLQRAGVDVRTCAYVEIEAFAAYNLVKKIEAGYLPVGPVYTDLKTFPSGQFRGCVDGLVGGYPCQPFSSAGQRKGEQDPRHLWPWIASAIRIIRPRWCVFENVEGHITKGLRNVLSDLGELGFRTTWGIFSASEVGLPHQRKRVFILANSISKGLERQSRDEQGATRQIGIRANRPTSTGSVSPARPGQQQYWWEPPRVIATELANSKGSGYGGGSSEECGDDTRWFQGNEGKRNDLRSETEGCSGDLRERRELGNTEDTGRRELVHESCETREAKRGHFSRASDQAVKLREIIKQMDGSADGTTDWMDYAELCNSVDNRTDELRLLGNGICPATFEKAWRELWKRMI